METAMTCDKNGFAFEMVHHPDDDSSLKDKIDGACEVFDINDEKTVALQANLVIGLVKEVEGKERAMDSDVGLDIVAKVDRLEQDQHHAKETNETHTGDEYAQNVVLATGCKKLEFPVTGVLEEGSKVHDKIEAVDITSDKNDFEAEMVTQPEDDSVLNDTLIRGCELVDTTIEDAANNKIEAANITSDKNNFEVEMVTHPEDDSALNDTIIRGCELVDTKIEDTENNKMDICKAVILDKNDFEFEMVNHPEAEDDSTFNNTITGSYELLDTTIEDAIDNKKTLASTIDLIISLMREVESKENTAEQAKEETARSGLDILAKLDELQQAHQHAKETNDTHARKVSENNAILTTGIKDLQSCVSGLLNEGGKLLEILDEIRRALEMRLASAIKEKELADKAKLEKESLAQKLFADEESQMLKVVEESQRLTQEAVKISKLQEFLIDRRQVVDILRKDISDKCVLVNTLKESLDQEVMQSGLFPSSQISSILASIVPSYEQQLKKDELTKTRKDWAEPTDSPVVSDSVDEHASLANQKQIKNGKSASVVFPGDEMLSEIEALDSEKMERNISNEPIVADITVLGRSMSTVVSAEANAERVSLLRSTVPKDYGKKSRGKKRKFRKMSGWGTVPRRIGCAGDPRGYF